MQTGDFYVVGSRKRQAYTGTMRKYEHRSKPVVPLHKFYGRVAYNIGFALVFIALSLFAGAAGYHHFENMNWVDALLNASMIAGGMGPVDVLHTDAGKLFASAYAIYSGLFLIIITGIVLAPVFHRLMHTFHQDTE